MTTDERIEKMERQLARMRWFNRCLIACIVLSLGAWFILKTFTTETAWAQSMAKVIRANAFILEDKQGKIRARLHVPEDGPELVLCDKNEKGRVGLSVTEEDGPALVLQDENGKARALMSMSMLYMKDENGKFRVMLSSVKDTPGLLLLDKNGKIRAKLVLTEDEPELDLFDENEKSRASLGMIIKDVPGLLLYNENGEVRAGLSVDKDGPELNLLDENGKLIWSAP